MSERTEIGALWRKVSERTGNSYYSGDIDIPGGGTLKVVAFDNDNKKNDRQPDIRIYTSEERKNSGGNNYQRPAAQSRTPQPASPKPEPVQDAIEYPEGPDPDDIPF